MKKNIIYSALLALAALGFASCSSDNDPVTSPDEVLTPIRISAAYSGGSRSTTRVAYAEDGDNISATWQAGDQLYVCYNGHVNTLSLSDGAGTATATFTGTIQGTPTSNSILICYVRDANSPSAVSVNNNGEYTYASGTFTSQDGTLAGAAKCNLYYGTTTYGTGEDISCTFSVNTSMLKFTVYAPDGVSAGDDATLTYKSNGTALAAASFTVGANGKNTIYMTVPAGQYTGEQTLQYVSGLADESKALSATKATFTAGQTYSKDINFGSSVHYPINSSTNWNSVFASWNAEVTPSPTLLFNCDLSVTSFIVTRDDGIIDLNGHSLNGARIQNNVRGKSVTFRNGTIGSGTLDGTDGVGQYFYGTVILDNMTVNSRIFTDGHDFIFNSGTYNDDIYCSTGSGYPGTATIYGGKFSKLDFWTDAHGTYILYGGKYKTRPQDSWCASGYSVKSNTDSDAATYPYIVSAD